MRKLMLDAAIPSVMRRKFQLLAEAASLRLQVQAIRYWFQMRPQNNCRNGGLTALITV